MGEILLQLIKLLVIDVIFVAALCALLIPLAMFKKASFALVKRNVIGYFSNPTGYVFLCVFVLLTSVCAVWPDQFFTSNLANLDQLSSYMPWVLLLFIPAITMSLWSEERRQGTDELLLTLPATDFDIVLGKYLAAAAIFTFSLLFSQFASYTVLTLLSLGDLDVGLIFTTYFGYWLMGLAMLSLGMVASFLTNNATVSFVLGMIFNMFLVAISYTDRVLATPSISNQVMQWSLASRFDDFGRGVISLSSTIYFLAIIATGIYISIILIGRRHWSGRTKDKTQSELTTLTIGVSLGLFLLGLVCFLVTSLVSNPRAILALSWSGSTLLILSLITINVSAIINAMQGGMLGHYMLRVECLLIAMLGASFFLSRHELFRRDLTSGKVASLAPDSLTLISAIDAKKPVTIDAFISAEVPKEFIKTKYNLISGLKELAQRSGGKITVRMHDNLEPFSEEAARAESRFGIKKQTVLSRANEKMRQEELIMGAAFTCGLEKVVVPFFGNGIPVEYELVRSIATVSKGDRKKLGVVTTDAQMFGGFSMQGMQPRNIPKQAIIEELEKQYRVEQVDPEAPIELGKYAALLVVQPSGLGPQALANVVDAIKAGQPCAIFEDPAPIVLGGGSVVGTNQPKPPQGGFMGMGGGPPPPKGDIRALWSALGIKPQGDNGNPTQVPGTIVWQDYNPYPRFQMPGIGPELVFIREEAPGAKNVFNSQAPAVAGFEEILFPFPSAIEQAIGSKLKFTELVTTASENTGTLDVDKWMANRGNLSEMRKEYEAGRSDRRYIIAADIRSEVPKSEDKSDGKKTDDKADEAKKPAGIHCVYVADIDVLDSQFLQLRNNPDADNNFRFDNVAFALNAIDLAAGDDRFLEIRSRKPRHSTLRLIEDKVAQTRSEEAKSLKLHQEAFTKSIAENEETVRKATEELQKKTEELQKLSDEGKLDPAQVAEFKAQQEQLDRVREVQNRYATVKKEQAQKKLESEQQKIRRDGDRKIESTQNSIKIAATTLPLIFPLVIGLLVYAQRRVREREGVSKSRLRY
ncbi:Gldg family protein [Anatilimnocola sp. NA78]|uniref:Gldg family protein n=1 Tax=Anatilimnocola sp. NA78 TaxID=3415683 RepID=UPI003CE58890